MQVTQAMILAAGYSTRLRPLSDDLPKPLLPFWDKTILDFTLRFLHQNGVRAAAINVHHARATFLEALKNEQSTPLTPFVEEPEILDTGGGIKNMESFVTEENFVVANCDFISSIDLKKAMKFHLKRKALATMVLLPKTDLSNYSTVGVDEEGKIVSFPYGELPGKPKVEGVFSGVHIFNRAIFSEMPEGNIFGVNRDLYPRLFAKEAPVYGCLQKASWLDLGETKLYAEAQFALLKKHPKWVTPFLEPFTSTSKGVYVSPEVLIPSGVRIKGPAFISANVTIGKGSQLGPNIVLGKGSTVAEKSQLQSVIVSSGGKVSGQMQNKIVSNAEIVPF